jgi:outer membrane protein OmpA-like peptidoglycan-associated protein
MNRIVLVGAVSLSLFAGCATMPKAIPELDQAHAAVTRLSSDPLAAQSASRELQSSRDALARADQAKQNKEPLDEVVHLSYLAERQAQIGEAHLAELRSRQLIAKGEADRNAVLLEARDRQAQQAVARAGVQTLQANAARGAAETARADLEESQRQLAELQAKQTERGMVLTLGDVLFDTSQADLKAGAAPTLNRVAQFLHENAQTRVLIEGYTDSRGSADYNQDLSRRRAGAVSTALEIRGAAPGRIITTGRGETLPVASNDTAEGRQRNRRVEIVFSDASGKFADNAVLR